MMEIWIEVAMKAWIKVVIEDWIVMEAWIEDSI